MSHIGRVAWPGLCLVATGIGKAGGVSTCADATGEWSQHDR